MYLLVKKFGFNLELKLDPIFTDLFYKVMFDEDNMHSFISLMIAAYNINAYSKASSCIQEICAKNSSPQAPFYYFQAQALMHKSLVRNYQIQFEIIKNILTSKDSWNKSRVESNLMTIEVFFNKETSAFKSLSKLDPLLFELLENLYKEGSYHLLAQICAKTIAYAGNQQNL